MQHPTEPEGFGRQQVAALYQRYMPKILRKCQRMLGTGSPLANEVAQETFLRLWDRRGELDDPGAVVGWLYVTATRLAIDRIRKRRSTLTEVFDLEDDVAWPDRIVAARRQLARTATLGAEEMELFVLRYLDGLTQPEIAEVLEVSERTVRRRLAELRDTLHRLLGEDDV